MPVFPPVRTIVAQPTTLPTPTLIAGEHYNATRYPLTALVDLTAKTAWRSKSTTVGLRFDLGTATNITYVGIVGHNLTPGTLCSVHASNDVNTLTTPDIPPDDEFSIGWAEDQVLSRAFASRRPNCWVDTRDAAGNPTFARYWQVHVHTNGVPVTLNEIVIGLGLEFHGTVKLPLTERMDAQQSRRTTDTGNLLVSATGAIVREMDLMLVLPPDDVTALQGLYANILAATPRAVIIPSTSVNDLWFVELPNTASVTYPKSWLEGEFEIAMVEEVYGVL